MNFSIEDLIKFGSIIGAFLAGIAIIKNDLKWHKTELQEIKEKIDSLPCTQPRCGDK